jgi:hypothetical protein
MPTVCNKPEVTEKKKRVDKIKRGEKIEELIIIQYPSSAHKKSSGIPPSDSSPRKMSAVIFFSEIGEDVKTRGRNIEPEKCYALTDKGTFACQRVDSASLRKSDKRRREMGQTWSTITSVCRMDDGISRWLDKS